MSPLKFKRLAAEAVCCLFTFLLRYFWRAIFCISQTWIFKHSINSDVLQNLVQFLGTKLKKNSQKMHLLFWFSTRFIYTLFFIINGFSFVFSLHRVCRRLNSKTIHSIYMVKKTKVELIPWPRCDSIWRVTLRCPTPPFKNLTVTGCDL